jgi:hypothetical protein
MTDPQRDFMIEMNKDIVKNKTKSTWNYIKHNIYFLNFYLYHNIPFFLTNIIILYFIKGNTTNKWITFFMASFSSWFLHWFSHKWKLFNFLSGHRLHHKEDTTFFEDAHEFLSDVFAAGLFIMMINYAIKSCIKKFIFNNYVLFFYMFAFPLVHLFTYHNVLKKSYHQEHHEETLTNFSPDFYDHLFNTNQDHRIEDTSHMIPIFLITGIVVIIIEKTKFITF